MGRDPQIVQWEKSLPRSAPKLVAINRDDHHARYVGRTEADEQFFLTFPFVASDSSEYPRRDFVALYVFDLRGKLLRAEITDLGTRERKNAAATRAVKTKACESRDNLLESLGQVTFDRVRVAPFEVRRFKLTFGLFSSPPEDPLEPWVVSPGPGWYMWFHHPWSSGEYQTMGPFAPVL